MLAILPTFSQPSRGKANVGPMMNVYWAVMALRKGGSGASEVRGTTI